MVMARAAMAVCSYGDERQEGEKSLMPTLASFAGFFFNISEHADGQPRICANVKVPSMS